MPRRNWKAESRFVFAGHHRLSFRPVGGVERNCKWSLSCGSCLSFAGRRAGRQGGTRNPTGRARLFQRIGGSGRPANARLRLLGKSTNSALDYFCPVTNRRLTRICSSNGAALFASWISGRYSRRGPKMEVFSPHDVRPNYRFALVSLLLNIRE